MEEINGAVDVETIILQPSCSLLHVPVTKDSESKMDPIILNGLSFADEKLKEIQAITEGANKGKASIQTILEESKTAREALAHSSYRQNQSVAQELKELEGEEVKRTIPFSKRIRLQREELKLPILPTTTIGSLPQTAEVKGTRTKWRKGDITNQEYLEFIDIETKKNGFKFKRTLI